MISDALRVAGTTERTLHSPLEEILLSLQSGLRYVYKSSWALLLNLYAHLFQHFSKFSQSGKDLQSLLGTMVTSLGELQESSEFHTEELKEPLYRALGE